MRLSRVISCLLLSLFSVGAFAAADPSYTQLRGARPDGRTIALSNFTFDRDAYHFALDGTLHLFQPVEGKTMEAVFIGRGSYTLTPAQPAERTQLAINADDKSLTT